MYEEKKFNLPELKGLSAKQIEVHLGLYAGYVKHTNLIMEQIRVLKDSDMENKAYVMAELRRRLGFEFDGMRMHEYYFSQFEGGPQAMDADGALAALSKNRYGENGIMGHVKEVAGTRGIGWVVVYYDDVSKAVHTAFVGDHELGQLAGLPILLAVDLWEHAFMVDYVPAQKKDYVDAFFENLNWGVVEKRLAGATK